MRPARPSWMRPLRHAQGDHAGSACPAFNEPANTTATTPSPHEPRKRDLEPHWGQPDVFDYFWEP